jgi:hypothetical protein
VVRKDHESYRSEIDDGWWAVEGDTRPHEFVNTWTDLGRLECFSPKYNRQWFCVVHCELTLGYCSVLAFMLVCFRHVKL